jgi:hypothetical protein
MELSKLAWIISGVFGGGYVLWLVVGVIEAMIDVKRRPREPMFWCHKHGYFRKKHVLPITGVTDVCPICFKEAWDKAGK